MELQYDGQMCASKVLAMTSAYVSDEYKDCRTLCDGYRQGCSRRVPVERTGMPIRRGAIHCKLENIII